MSVAVGSGCSIRQLALLRNQQLRRLLALVHDLTTPDDADVAGLGARHGVARGTIKRDLNVLRDAGYQVEKGTRDKQTGKSKRRMAEVPARLDVTLGATELAAAQA